MKRLLVVGAALLLSVGLTGCIPPDRREEVPLEDEQGWVIDPDDLSTFTATLPSGRQVECLVVTWRGSAIQCWDVVE